MVKDGSEFQCPVSCCLLWFLAGRRKPVCDVKGLPVDSVTLLGGQASFPSSSIAHFSLSTSFPGGLAGNQQREKVIEVLKRNCLREEEAGSKGEQLRSDVIQLCREEFSMNIMINFLIIRSLRRLNSSPRGSGGNPIAWSFLIRLEKHSQKMLQRKSLMQGDGHVTQGGLRYLSFL